MENLNIACFIFIALVVQPVGHLVFANMSINSLRLTDWFCSHTIAALIYMACIVNS